MQATEILITSINQVQGAIWLHDHAFIGSVREVADSHFYSMSMRLFGVVIEACDLADGKRDVGSCIHSKIK